MEYFSCALNQSVQSCSYHNYSIAIKKFQSTFNRDSACERNLFIATPIVPAALWLVYAPCHAVFQVPAISMHWYTHMLMESQSIKPFETSFVQTIVQTFKTMYNKEAFKTCWSLYVVHLNFECLAMVQRDPEVSPSTSYVGT